MLTAIQFSTLFSDTLNSRSRFTIGYNWKTFYEGTYPKNIRCGYKFLGEPGQRIRLEFRDFDLFYGGAQWVSAIYDPITRTEEDQISNLLA